jgi:endonuclease/exonuclease/phosphatase family metal-dependent hydrolase
VRQVVELSRANSAKQFADSGEQNRLCRVQFNELKEPDFPKQLQTTSTVQKERYHMKWNNHRARHHQLPLPVTEGALRFRTLFVNRAGIVLAAGILLVSSWQSSATGPALGGKRSLDTMTVNLYVGGGTERILALDPTAPGYLSNLVVAVTGVYYEIAASDPHARLHGVAKAIAERKPDLVAVEEASLVRNQSPGDLLVGGTSPATNVVFDYLEILVQELAAQGASYAVVSSIDEFDVELPMLNLQTGSIDDARLTDRDAILVRTDLPPGFLTLSHAQSGHFVNLVPLPSIGLSVLRGWCSVDVAMRGENFRFICAHLEQEVFPDFQLAQAQELIAGPAHAKIPVVLAGDFNADTMHRNGTVTYDALIAAGFNDAWASVHTGALAGGLTWGHDEFLADPTVAMVWRVDLVLFRGGDFVTTSASTVDMALNRAEPPFWASDHAALSVSMQIAPNRQRMAISQAASVRVTSRQLE